MNRLSHSHPFEADVTHLGRKSLARVFITHVFVIAVCRSLPTALVSRAFREPRHRAGRTDWALPRTTFCPPREMPPLAPSRPRPPCRHPLLQQRAGSPPCPVSPPVFRPRPEPSCTECLSRAQVASGSLALWDGACAVHQDPMSGHPSTASHCDNQTLLQTSLVVP